MTGCRISAGKKSWLRGRARRKMHIHSCRCCPVRGASVWAAGFRGLILARPTDSGLKGPHPSSAIRIHLPQTVLSLPSPWMSLALAPDSLPSVCPRSFFL
ncbi:hypothetical protein BKA80DRAFT_38076 [Phyllosticta citrichinensis]